MAFYVSKEWIGRIITTKLISDRFAVIRFDLEKEGQLAVVNVYGPTGVVTRENPEKGREFHDQVQEVYKSSMFFILGDFNSKIGLKAPTDTDFMGSYGKSKSRRNENGKNLRSW